jgi:hypothetical protein
VEFATFQPDGGIDDRYVPHEAQCLTAFDLYGNILWNVLAVIEGRRSACRYLSARQLRRIC